MAQAIPRSNGWQALTLHEITFQEHFRDLCERAKVKRKNNGLRHAFCTYHFAAHANENQTAAQAGNSPAMIHQHYKGLATKAEGEKWFNVLPHQQDKVCPPRRKKSKDIKPATTVTG